METTTTDKIFKHALDQAMPEHGEGWDVFTDILHKKMSEMESLLRQVLPDYADEVEHANGGRVCAEMTEKDVVMIRDFLANAGAVPSGDGVADEPKLKSL